MFVVIEGIDGSGKSTQVPILQSRLTLVDYPVKPNVVKFPVYDSPTGRVLEKLLKTGLKSLESCLLFQSLMAVNRQEYFALEYDPTTITIADRYTLSGLVYGLAQGLDKGWLSAINAGLPEPAATIFLDVPPQHSFQRRPERTDVLEEDPKFLQAIYDLYKENLPPGTFIIDGTRPVDWVTREILDKLLLVNDSLTYSF